MTTGADTKTDQAFLESLRTVLAAEVPARDLDRLVVHRVRRDRSSVYFVDLDGPTPERRWVVKQPEVTLRQVDLDSPSSAADQFKAHLRLHEHLERLGGAVRTPRPIGVMPDVDAYVMEFVPGPDVRSHIALRSVRRPDALLEGMVASARVLRSVHSLEPAAPETVRLGDLEDETRTSAAEVIRSTGLRVPDDGFFTRSPHDRTETTSTVVLHGDAAPENVLLAPDGIYCLDAALATKGAPEQDVVRYLVMLYQEKLFVRVADEPHVQRLRRRAGATFLDAYYEGRPWPDALQPLAVLGVAARYAHHQAAMAETPPHRSALRAARRRALMPALKVQERRYFQRLVDEVSAPGYFERVRAER